MNKLLVFGLLVCGFVNIFGALMPYKPSRPTLKTDPYEILGVSQNSSPKEIAEAYRKKTRSCHPDKSRGSHEDMAALNEAYEQLGKGNPLRPYEIKKHQEEIEKNAIIKQKKEYQEKKFERKILAPLGLASCFGLLGYFITTYGK